MAKSKGKPWEKLASARKIDSRERRRTVIFCEDSKSSAHYLSSFPIDADRFEVRVEGTGMNTDSLVEDAIRAKLDAEKRRTPFNEVWCVFDRDDFPLEKYERAFTLARNEGIKIAWANEAFEFWYLLHFDYFDRALIRADYKRKLADREIEYDKADRTMYARLQEKQQTALRNARKLQRHWNENGKSRPHCENPSTSIHVLVEYLNELGAIA